MKYQVSKLWWFPELGRKPEPGEVVELDQAVAERYMSNEPGLLKPVRQTTQRQPAEVRTKKPKKTRTRARS